MSPNQPKSNSTPHLYPSKGAVSIFSEAPSSFRSLWGHVPKKRAIVPAMDWKGVVFHKLSLAEYIHPL